MAKEVKFLGVILDSKLTFAKHATETAKKASRLWSQCYRVTGPRWGLSPASTKWLYDTITGPVLGYAAVIWSRAIEKRGVEKKLDSVQRLALLHVTGAMRTTPTSALEVLTNTPPLTDRIQAEAVKGYLRLRSNQEWRRNRPINEHNSICSIASKWLGSDDVALERSRATYITDRNFGVEIDLEADWGSKTLPPCDEESIVCYTDGSKKKNGQTGAAVLIENSGTVTEVPVHGISG